MSNTSPTSTVAAARADSAVQAARGMRAALMAMGVSGVLGAVKVIAGVAGHSYAPIADGVESLLDIVSSIAVWGSLKVAAADPNHRFPYGYGKAEPLAGLVIAAGLVVVAGVLAVQSIHEIRKPHQAPEAFTLIVLVVVVAVKELLFRWLVQTGREIESRGWRATPGIIAATRSLRLPRSLASRSRSGAARATSRPTIGRRSPRVD